MTNDTDRNGRPGPEVSEKPVRRRFTGEYKLRIIEEADGCTDKGQVGECESGNSGYGFAGFLPVRAIAECDRIAMHGTCVSKNSGVIWVGSYHLLARFI